MRYLDGTYSTSRSHKTIPHFFFSSVPWTFAPGGALIKNKTSDKHQKNAA